MQALRVGPIIHIFDTFKEFADQFNITKKDVVLTHEFLYEPFIKPLGIESNFIFQEKYGVGEPSDEMIDAIYLDMKKFEYDRVIAFGGGTIVDIAKLYALKVPDKVLDLFQGVLPPIKEKELVIIPTTCGTGSEATNISIVELKSLHTKKGLAADQLYADHAVLIPETVKGLPYKFFVTSSVDALIHAIESYLSPKASPFTEMYSLAAIKMIMDGYKKIIEKGENERFEHLHDFLIASCYAGIAFGNAGCAAVHALSYSVGAAFHVPHGEVNYQFFTEVFKMYARKNPTGKLSKADAIFADVLGCDTKNVYDELEVFLGKLIAKKHLKEYGMVEAQIDEFTDSTIANQQRLLGNNYVFLEREEIREIFANLY